MKPLSRMNAQLLKCEIPGKRSLAGSTWSDLVSAEMLRQMRLSPGATFRVTSADGDPIPFSPTDTSAIRAACPEPFRLQSRAIEPGPKGNRHIWLSFDPGHWEKLGRKQ